MYWLFENDDVGVYVVNALTMEEAKEIAEEYFPTEEFGENWCYDEPITLWEVDAEGYDVY